MGRAEVNANFAGPFKIKIDFDNIGQFLAFAEEREEFFSDRCEHLIVQHCKQYGVRSDLFGDSPPTAIQILGPFLREHFMVNGLNPRQRTVADEVVTFLLERKIAASSLKIYSHEAITPLALAMRGRFSKYIGTEFAPNEKHREELYPINHGDICRSEFPSARFDVVMSCDVFEHIPDIDVALRETVRILSRHPPDERLYEPRLLPRDAIGKSEPSP